MNNKISLLVLVSAILVGCSKDQGISLDSSSGLMSNSGFEHGLDGYEIFDGGGGYAQLDAGAALNGTSGLRLYRTAISPRPEALPKFDPAKKYRVSVWARVIEAVPDDLTNPWPFLLIVTSSTSGIDVRPLSANQFNIKTRSWTRYEQIVSPEALAGAEWSISITISSSWNTRNVLEIDDFTIEEL